MPRRPPPLGWNFHRLIPPTMIPDSVSNPETQGDRMAARQILVTSALPYANGSIHIGHLVEYIQTDIWVRYQRLRGNVVTYVCGDDAHGTPIMLAAQKAGVSPEEWIAKYHIEHKEDFARFGVAFDHYGSTN